MLYALVQGIIHKEEDTFDSYLFTLLRVSFLWRSLGWSCAILCCVYVVLCCAHRCTVLYCFSVFVDNGGSEYMDSGEARPGIVASPAQTAQDITTTFTILLAIFFPSVTGM